MTSRQIIDRCVVNQQNSVLNYHGRKTSGHQDASVPSVTGTQRDENLNSIEELSLMTKLDSVEGARILKS